MIKKFLLIGTITTMMVLPGQANAFSFKKFIANPFKASINSVLNPFHVVYKFNTAFGFRHTTGIPREAFTAANEERFRETGQWRWDIKSQNDYWKRPVQDDFSQPPLVVRPDPYEPPPTDVVLQPPCNRGGRGITPC